MIAIDRETCTIDMPYGSTNFQSTVVKPYHTEEPDTSEENNPEMPVLTEEVPIPIDKAPIDEELSNQSQDEQQDSQEVCWSGCQSHLILHYNNQFIVDMSRDDFSMAFLS